METANAVCGPTSNVKTLKIKEFTLNIFLSFKSLIIQSKKKIIFEKNFIKEDAEDEGKKVEKKLINIIFDLHIDEENNNILYALIVNGQLKIYKISFDSLYNSILSKVKSEEDEEDSENNDDEESIYYNSLFQLSRLCISGMAFLKKSNNWIRKYRVYLC